MGQDIINLTFSMGQVIRRAEIRRRRARKSKLHDLRERYAAAKTKKDRDVIVAKFMIVAPWLKTDYLEPSVK